MPQKCICYGCNNSPDPVRGIGLHRIPFIGDERPEAKRRRNKWVKFITTKRKDWKMGPKSRANVCSAHFRPEDFVNRYTSLYNTKDSSIIKRLVSDDFGILAFPTIHAGEGAQNVDITAPTPSPRERRIIMREIMNDPLYASILHPERMKTEENNSKQSTTDHGETQNIKSDGNDNNTSQADILGEPGSKTDSSDKSQLSCSNSASDTDIVSNSVPDICKTHDKAIQTQHCLKCYELKDMNHKLNNRIKGYQFKMKQKNAAIMKLKRRVQKLELEKLGITKVTAQPKTGQIAIIQTDHNYTGW